MSNIEQGNRAKIEEIDSTNQSLFKNLLRRVPEKSYVLGRYDRNLTRKFYEREDVVKLKWWKHDGKRTNNIETLKQERKIPNGGVAAVFPADNTAAQIAILIVERGETPTEMEWERKDILVRGDLNSSDLEMNESTRISYVFDKVQDKVLSAAL